jgi:prephenate dehydratase
MNRIAFQGEKGAYSEKAAIGFFGDDLELQAHASFKDVFESVENNDCTAAVLPIENTLAGSVHQNYDLLLKRDLTIIGEIYVRIVHCLLALQGVSMSEIIRIYSHPQALQQCSDFLEKWENIDIIPTYDTAGSAKLLLEQQIRNGAAIAGEQAASDYGLQVLRKGIESNHQNYTRFIILKKQGMPPATGGKTSIVFSFKDIPGALFKALSGFAFREINLLKVESRPLHGQPWKYFFYLDFEGSIKEESIQNAIRQLQEITTYLKVLGSYPIGTEIE